MAHNIYESPNGFCDYVNIYLNYLEIRDKKPGIKVGGNAFWIPFSINNPSSYKGETDYAILDVTTYSNLPSRCFEIKCLDNRNDLREVILKICGFPGMRSNNPESPAETEGEMWAIEGPGRVCFDILHEDMLYQYKTTKVSF